MAVLKVMQSCVFSVIPKEAARYNPVKRNYIKLRTFVVLFVMHIHVQRFTVNVRSGTQEINFTFWQFCMLLCN